MADEAVVVVSLQITKNNMQEQCGKGGFSSDVTREFGPSPGAILVSLDGTDINLDELDSPGLCYLCNLDDTNFVEYGIWEPANSRFYPWGELLPGEEALFRFSRNVRQEYQGTGTGTTAPTNTVRFKANTAPVRVQIKAYDR